jgi:polyisoprenoid-binding protein YceI
MTAIRTSLLAAGALFALSGSAFANEWQIDSSHTTAQFSIKHMMVATVRGQFQKVTGTVNLDDADQAKATVDVTIDASTIDTREPKRDAHLKSADFFDVAKYPTITFKSTRVEKAGTGKFKVTGDLTMHGQTHPVTLSVDTLTAAVKTPWGSMSRGVSATGKLNRKDWGLTWNKPIDAVGGVLVSDEVTLQIDAELGAKAAEAAAASAKK